MTRQVCLEDGLCIGDGNFLIIAGPCAVESFEQMDRIGLLLSGLGIRIMRGGIFKPRTDPHTFQGLGLEGLKILKSIKEKYKLNIVSEIVDPRDLEEAIELIDIFQVGSRNMQNYALLKELGKTHKPVMIKRGMSATIKEWIMAAEYVSLEGNNKIVLCERGIRTFDDYTRNTLDLMSVPIIKEKTDYPIFVDPSHGTGRRELILPATKAAKALNADGAIIEIHPSPDDALSDGFQSLDFDDFTNLYNNISQ